MRNISLAIATLISTIALPVNAQSTWTGSGKITQVYTQSNGTVLFQHQNTSNVPSCPGNTGVYWALEKSHLNNEKTYALLLTAYTNQIPVKIQVSGCTSDGYKKIGNVIMGG